MHLTAIDYVVIIVMMVIPLGIGLFYAWKDSGKANRNEYLLGGRKMGVVPVTLSILVSFLSAVSLLGTTSDLYRYGPMVIGFYIGSALGSMVGFFTVTPLMYPLQLLSVYDYLEMRFRSQTLRMIATVMGIAQTFLFMVVAILAPGLALQAAAGIPFWVSVAVVGGVGIFYTAIGGIKSVIWADVFQAGIMVVGVLVLVAKGAMHVGSVDKVWSIAEQGGRTSMATVSPDPRTRHSWWSVTIGIMFLWQTVMFNQANIQRVRAVKSLKSAKLSSLLSIPCYMIFGVFLAALGIVTYAYFYTIRCDPLEGGLISNINQVTLYFMLIVFQDYPGLSGFYMATIFSAALSSLSSGINAIAANTVEDILGGWLRGVSERTVIVIAKVLVFVYGFAIVGVAYLAKSLQGPVTQTSVTVTGAFGSVLVGIFLMGCTVPWANKYGAFVGGLLTLAFNLWMSLGNLWYGRRTRPLPSPFTDQCYLLTSDSGVHNMTLSNATGLSLPAAGSNDPYEYGFFLYDISYEWYACIGTVVCSLCILVVSKLTRNMTNDTTEARFIVPMLRKYWHLHDNNTSTSVDEHHLDSLNLDT